MYVDAVEKAKQKMMSMKNWAVIGVTQDKGRYGYKIYKILNEKGYVAYGINPKYDEVDGEKVYPSIKDLPEKVDCVDFLVNPAVTLKLLDEVASQGIRYVWFQPGSFDEDVLDKAESLGLEMVYYDCVYAELMK